MRRSWQLVGILNVTPDSFSDGGQFLDPKKAVAHAVQLFADGASIVDLGAESTRPNAKQISDDEEWRRLEPVLRELIPRYPGKISLDSHRPANVRRALAIGSVIVNDITGMHNPEMVRLVLELKPKVIIMQMPGTDAQQAHRNPTMTTPEQVRKDLLAQADKLEAGGLPRDHITLDPGIGFGKTMELNRELLKFAKLVPEYPVMIGYSRKRFLGDGRMELAPNIEAGKIAIANGAAYLRVHDVVGHRHLL